MDDPVLLTGAGGRVGQAILNGIGDTHEWRLLDREPLSSDRLPVGVDEDDVVVADASSNHAVSAYETDEHTPGMYRTDDDYRLDGTELPRPGNLYGVSKAAGETLGRYYHDAEGLSVVCVRIGNLTQGHPPRNYERGQAMWLSHRDCAHLFDRCIRADYDYEIVYGISDNERKYYSIERAKAVLGYDPQDDSAGYTLAGDPKEGA
jgi:NAD+ dependent glucose-6-phosphate dehydrogenase